MNTLVVKNELGETEIRFRLGLGDQPRAGTLFLHQISMEREKFLKGIVKPGKKGFESGVNQ